jgi:hypothetical protein
LFRAKIAQDFCIPLSGSFEARVPGVIPEPLFWSYTLTEWDFVFFFGVLCWGDGFLGVEMVACQLSRLRGVLYIMCGVKFMNVLATFEIDEWFRSMTKRD